MTSTDPQGPGSRAAAISNLVVRLMSEYAGRGPTRARTYLQDDFVCCLVADTLTHVDPDVELEAFVLEPLAEAAAD